MPELHLLVLAPLEAQDRQRLEAFCNSVSYGERELGDPNSPYSAKTDDMRRANCLIGWQAPEQAKSAKELPNLVWWMLPAAGADRLLNKPIWQDTNMRKQVTLTSNSGSHMAVIPSFVISMVLNLFQRTKDDIARQVLQKKWIRRPDYYIKEMAETTWGILGYGRLGRETARLAKAFGCRVLAATSTGERKRDPEAALLGLRFGDEDGTIPEQYYSSRDEDALKEFLGQLDVLVICVPGTGSTRQMFDRRRLCQLKKGAMLVNIGRGEVIHTDDLVAVLQEGHLGGAALDVQDPEPFPEDHPLWSLDNVIITPHIAGCTEKYLSRSVDIWLANAQRFRDGKQLLNVIDLDKGY